MATARLQVAPRLAAAESRRRLFFEPLEERQLLATYVVSSVADEGPGSLRQAIVSANSHVNLGGPDTIRFNILGSGPKTIHVGSATGLPLPPVTDAVIIDGATQSGAQNAPKIELEGAAAGAGASGLTIVAGGSTVRRLVINRFGGHGIRIEGGGGNRLEGNYLGTDVAGTADLGNGGAGVSIFFSSNNTIGGTTARQRNLISGNEAEGVAIVSSVPSIDGIQLDGALPIGPPYSGVFTPHEPLAAFQGEDPNGVWTLNVLDTFPSADDGNVRAFSLIACTTDGSCGTFSYADPPVAVPPAGTDNVDVPLVASGLSGPISDVRFRLDGTACSADEGATTVGLDHTFVGDLVLKLTSPAGTAVTLIDSAGGSGNNFCQTLLADAGNRPPAQNNRIVGNYIGVDVTGRAALGNSLSGVLIHDSPHTAVGGSATGASNVIAANGGAGVLVQANENIVAGNMIGTDAAGRAALGNRIGVLVRGRFNRLGTDGDGVRDAAERNVISGNELSGVQLLAHQVADGPPAPAAIVINAPSSADITGDNVVAGNYIGVDATGRSALGNGGDGVEIHDRDVLPGRNRIGTNGDGRADAAERNVIAANGGAGIRIDGAENVVAGNYIGVDATGKAALGNEAGVTVSGARNRLGTNGDNRADAAERNVISGNFSDGVQIAGRLFFPEPIAPASLAAADDAPLDQRFTTQFNVVAGNFIGLDFTGERPLGNGGIGVAVENAAATQVGANGDGRADVAERNLISANQAGGVSIRGVQNAVAGNFIGTDVTGTKALGNGGDGVSLAGGGNRVGTDGNGVADLAERNIIAASASDGVRILDNPFAMSGGGGLPPAAAALDEEALPSDDNVVAGNLIGVDASGLKRLGNGGYGVAIDSELARGDHLVRNIISANQRGGVLINGADDNVVAGNLIGSDVAGLRGLGNGGPGVTLLGGALTTRFRTETVLVERTEIHEVCDEMGCHEEVVTVQVPEQRQIPFTAVSGHGNRLGTDGDGLADAAERNLISANRGEGVLIIGAGTSGPEPCPDPECFPEGEEPLLEDEPSLAMEALVAGNLIGTNIAGLLPLGNARAGVLVIDASGNQIGGPGLGNVIAFNGAEGVGVRGDSAGNPIRANSIHSNVGLGIDLGGELAAFDVPITVSRSVFETRERETVEIVVLAGGTEIIEVRRFSQTVSRQVLETVVQRRVSDLGGDGVSLNDPQDADGGPNGLQNFPTLQSVRHGFNTRISGSLDSQPEATFTIDFYASLFADPTGFGEGAHWIGSAVITTDELGHAEFDARLPAFTWPGEPITATATDAAGNTSEFSLATGRQALVDAVFAELGQFASPRRRGRGN